MAIISPEEIKKRYGTQTPQKSLLDKILGVVGGNTQNLQSWFQPNVAKTYTQEVIPQTIKNITGPQKTGILPTLPPLKSTGTTGNKLLDLLGDVSGQGMRAAVNVIPNYINTSARNIYNPETKKWFENEPTKEMTDFWTTGIKDKTLAKTPEWKEVNKYMSNKMTNQVIGAGLVMGGIKDVSGGVIPPLSKFGPEKIIEPPGMIKGPQLPATQTNIPPASTLNALTKQIPQLAPQMAAGIQPQIPQPQVGGVENLVEEARKYKNVDDFIQSQQDYRDAHSAPSFDTTPVKERMESGGDFNLIEVVKGQHNQPSDYFDPRVGARYYMYDTQEGQESLTAINNIKRAVESGNLKGKTVTTYRTVPKNIEVNKLQDRDWVTFSKEYAVMHGEHRFGEGEYKIIKQEVDPKNLWWDGNDINEWGYDTGKTKTLSNSELRDIWNKAQSQPIKTGEVGGVEKGITELENKLKQNNISTYDIELPLGDNQHPFILSNGKVTNPNIAHHEVANKFISTSEKPIQKFMLQTGSVRLMGSNTELGVEMIGMPNSSQMDSIRKAAYDKPITFDIIDNNGKIIKSGLTQNFNDFKRQVTEVLSQPIKTGEVGGVEKVQSVLNKNSKLFEQINSGVSGKDLIELTPEEIKLRDEFFKYTAKPEVNAKYEAGAKDTEIIQDFLKPQPIKTGGVTTQTVPALQKVLGTPTSPQLTQQPQLETLLQMGGQLPSGPKIPSQESIPLTDKELIDKLTETLKKAKPIRGEQEKLYRQERARKLAQMMSARGKMAGEKGYFSELGALKGELPKIQFETIRNELTQENIDRLFNMLKGSKKLDEWQKISAQGGLAKILGEKGGGVPTKGELSELNAVFGPELTKALLEKRPMIEKLGELGMQLYNLPRSVMAGAGDLSATLMQNLMFAYRHPILTSKNFVEELKYFANPKYFDKAMEEIFNRPNYPLMKEAKLSLTNTGPILTEREEQFMAPIAEKIPGLGHLIKASGRAYTGFLNKMRADTFDQIVNSYKVTNGGEISPEFTKSLGSFINIATGRGSLGSFEGAGNVLAQGFFSARKLVAAFQMVNPMTYVKADPFVRKEMLRTVLAFIGGGLTILGLAKMAGAEVGNDPTSTDYGKIKIGNTRFNIFGSYQQMAVLMARLWKGYGTSSTTGKKFYLGDEDTYKPVTRMDLITRFFESKEHPTLSLLISMLKGQNNIGQPIDVPVEVGNRFVPMILSDGYDLYKEHGPVGLLGLIPAILGVPAQTYGTQIPYHKKSSTGKTTIKLKPTGGLIEDILNKVRNVKPSDIPQSRWESIVKSKESQTSAKISKEEKKREKEKNKNDLRKQILNKFK